MPARLFNLEMTQKLCNPWLGRPLDVIWAWEAAESYLRNLGRGQIFFQKGTFLIVFTILLAVASNLNEIQLFLAHPLPLEIPQMQGALDFRFEAPGPALFEPRLIQKFAMADPDVFRTCKAAQILDTLPSTFASWSGYWKIYTTLAHTGSVMNENRPTPAYGLYYVRNARESGMIQNTQEIA
ncbi:hypothetical protein DFH06DRAFT_1139257 [Mycena polygramma]|nr:hypothetical protein DFH06DRAFT_1139257 [Mycena polygramma]